MFRKNKMKWKKGLAIVLVFMFTVIHNDVIADAESDSSKISSPRISIAEKIKRLDSPEKDLSEYSVYSCLYFGSYPQSEIIPENTKYSAFDVSSECDSKYIQDGYYIADDALYSSLISATGWDKNGDIILNGEKYRRITEEDATYVGEYDDQYQWDWLYDADYHYFKYEPIKWKVLSVNENRVVLQSALILDNKQYHTVRESVVWENCTLRSWLNGYGISSNAAGKDYSSQNFIDTAFSSQEQEAIVTTELDNNASVAEEVTTTSDKIYVLSASDVLETDTAFAYGFDNEIERMCLSSSYAKAMGADIDVAGWHYAPFSKWWLRSVGTDKNTAVCVGNSGLLSMSGSYVNYADIGVCPAITLDISNHKLFILTEKSGSGRDGRLGIEYDIVSFGNYPQAEIVPSTSGILQSKYLKDGDVIVDDILYERLKKEAGWDENETLTIDDEKYCRLSKENVSSGYSYLDNDWENNLEAGGYLYFKYQPISWKVLQLKEDKALLLSDIALDNHLYAMKWYKDVESLEKDSWKLSDLRSWLNGYTADENASQKDYSSKNFINTAFSDSEQSVIEKTVLSNEGLGEDTSDKLFVISKSEISGDGGFPCFAKDENVADILRCNRCSTYAKALGTWSYNAGYEGNCSTWLRNAQVDEYGEEIEMNAISTAGSLTNLVSMTPGDSALVSGLTGNEDSLGVCVAMTLDANSELYSYLDTVKIGKMEKSETTEVPNPTESPIETSKIKKGDKITVSEQKYEVTNVSKKTVTYIAEKNNKKTNVSIPTAIKVIDNGKNAVYKVTSIKEKAFEGNKKVKKITISKNIQSIGKNAFKNCVNLKTLVIKSSNITKVGKNALKGTAKNLVIKVPAKKVSAYKKLFKSKGNNNMIVKKS